MGELISMAAERQARRLTVEEAWAAYVRAQTKAKATLSLEDGLAAGRAWGDFIGLFLLPQ